MPVKKLLTFLRFTSNGTNGATNGHSNGYGGGYGGQSNGYGSGSYGGGGNFNGGGDRMSNLGAGLQKPQWGEFNSHMILMKH